MFNRVLPKGVNTLHLRAEGWDSSSSLEHTWVITQLLRETRENKVNLVVLWSDLANGYCSLLHKLVERSLQMHHVSEAIRGLLRDCYNGFHLRASAG